MEKIILFVLTILILITISLCVKNNINRHLDEQILLGMNYISNHTLPDGKFVYKTNLNPKVKYNDKKYNCLRHAGTLYAMYLCEKVFKNDSLKEKRYLASEYLIKNYLREISPNLYAIVSNPEEEGLESPEAKLGGCGLALIGLSNLYPEGKIDLKILRGLGNFVLFMQNPDGSFTSKYNITSHSKDESFNSLYYPGEAAYGILFLNDVDAQTKWVECSQKALLYLANSRKDKTNIPFDHWAMLATRKLFETPNNTLTKDEKILLQKHAEQVANVYLDQQITDTNSIYYGGFHSDLRLCSVGTIIEGYVAIYYITDDKNLKKQIKNLLDKGTLFLSNFQVKEGVLKGGIPKDAYWKAPDSQNSSKQIRIDNVQHVISGWITYQKLLSNK